MCYVVGAGQELQYRLAPIACSGSHPRIAVSESICCVALWRPPGIALLASISCVLRWGCRPGMSVLARAHCNSLTPTRNFSAGQRSLHLEESSRELQFWLPSAVLHCGDPPGTALLAKIFNNHSIATVLLSIHRRFYG